MHGDIVAASKWLGASMILASGLLVGGLHWVLSTNVDRLVRSMAERPPDVVSLAAGTAILPHADQDAPARDIHALVEQFRRDANDLELPGSPPTSQAPLTSNH